jgi:hypothetical protein
VKSAVFIDREDKGSHAEEGDGERGDDLDRTISDAVASRNNFIKPGFR